MKFWKAIKTFVFIHLFLLVFNLEYIFSLEKLFVVNLPIGKWMPNTVLINGLPVFFYKDNWYLCCEGGLIRFNNLAKEFFIHSLPNIKSEYPRITGMAKVNNTLWISMMRDDGILIFDLETQSLTGSFSIAKGTGFGEGCNLEITPDFYNKKIWVSSYNHLDVFHLKTNQWQNLDNVFDESKIGLPSSHHIFLPDDNSVWISSFFCLTKGGVQLDLKNDKCNTVFFKELTGTSYDGFIVCHLISSPRFLWVYYAGGDNFYNFYISVYDKQNNTWKSYHREKIIPAIELLIKELPNIKWVKNNFLLEDLIRISHENHSLSNDHPYKFKPNEIKLLNSGVKKLKSAFKKYNINYKFVNYGLYNHSLHNSTIYIRNQPWGKVKPVHRLKLNQVRFEQFIGSTGNYVVLETNKGIALLDTEKYTLKYLTPLTKLSGDKLNILWSKDRKRASILESHFPPDDPSEYYLISLDFNKLKITKIKVSEVQVAKIKDSLPQNKILLSEKEIILRWDGLLTKKFKKS